MLTACMAGNQLCLPTFAQQNATLDPKVMEQLGVLGQKYHEAYENNDAAALAALYTWDAIIVTPQGAVYGRDAIENWYADQCGLVFRSQQPDQMRTQCEANPHPALSHGLAKESMATQAARQAGLGNRITR